VVECLTSKLKALSSNPITTRKKSASIYKIDSRKCIKMEYNNNHKRNRKSNQRSNSKKQNKTKKTTEIFHTQVPFLF
jgi:hypothetical protein